ncbi:hypothetical protein EMCRGX_G008288 [Ephydatia muelleri]
MITHDQLQWVLLVLACLCDLDSAQQLCSSQTNCSLCIQASPSCQWCSDPSYAGSRCFSFDTPNINCSKSFVENPIGTKTAQTMDVLGSTVQISPGVVNITVRPGSITNFTLSIRPARNYPLDLYILTDLSYSFNNDLSTLKTLGTNIANTLYNITTDYRIGFGSFVDKKVSPYVDVTPSSLTNSNAPYSFRHSVSLTSNITLFNSTLQAQVISYNQDEPEGGFDGFMQVLLCKKLIGWRDNARHLLLYDTDADSHQAGDGKLGGVVKPNPHTCLMNDTYGLQDVDYQAYGLYDYPSLGDIREQLRINNVIPILAVTSDELARYMAYTKELESVGATVGTLAADSSNILNLISSAYKSVTQKIVFDPVLPAGISSLKFIPINCPQLESDGITCSGVQIEQTVNFTVQVQLASCANNQTMQIPVRVVGFGTFTINVQPICSCGCESSGPAPNSTSCTNGNGILSCGVCKCNPGRFGTLCQCNSQGVGQGSSTSCPTGPNQMQCSGQSRGTCVCGKCECATFQDSRFGTTSSYFGSACECDNSRCDTTNGQLCGGTNQGVCQCGGCQCLGSYYGSACQCSNTLCVDPNDSQGRVCNGRGTCSCNQCSGCQAPFTGVYCQSCQASTPGACASFLCQPNLVCAQCALGQVNNTLCSSCPSLFLLNTTDINSIQGSITQCQFTDSKGCTYTYYTVEDANVVLQSVYVDSTPVCPTVLSPASIAAIVITPLVVIAIIGVAILLTVMLIFYLLNRAELRRFEKEVSKASFAKNLNPLYIAASTDIMNPIFDGGEVKGTAM